jgi:hypothetical protein
MRYFYLLYVDTGFEAHTASCVVGAGVCPSGTHSHLVQRLKMRGIIPSHPHMSSLNAQGQLYLHNIFQEAVLGLPGSGGNLKQTSVVRKYDFKMCIV